MEILFLRAHAINLLPDNRLGKSWLQQFIRYRIREHPIAEERNQVVNTIRFNMGHAFTNFCNVCEDHRHELEKAAREDDEMMHLLIDIALIPLIIVPTSAITRASARIAAYGVPDFAYRRALAIVRDPAPLVDKINDLLKTVIKESAKRAATSALTSSGSINFVVAMRRAFGSQVMEVGRRLVDSQSFSDNELKILLATYDGDLTTEEIYDNKISELLRRYEREVESIKSLETLEDFGRAYTERVKAYWINVESSPSPRLALLRTRFGTENFFVTWVSPELQEIAITKSEALFGQIETVNESDVQDLPH